MNSVLEAGAGGLAFGAVMASIFGKQIKEALSNIAKGGDKDTPIMREISMNTAMTTVQVKELNAAFDVLSSLTSMDDVAIVEELEKINDALTTINETLQSMDFSTAVKPFVENVKQTQAEFKKEAETAKKASEGLKQQQQTFFDKRQAYSNKIWKEDQERDKRMFDWFDDMVKVPTGVFRDLNKTVSGEVKTFDSIDKNTVESNVELVEYGKTIKILEKELADFTNSDITFSQRRTVAMFELIDKQSEMQAKLTEMAKTDQDLNKKVFDRGLLKQDYRKLLNDQLLQKNSTFEKTKKLYKEFSKYVGQETRTQTRDFIGRALFGPIYDMTKEITGDFKFLEKDERELNKNLIDSLSKPKPKLAPPFETTPAPEKKPGEPTPTAEEKELDAKVEKVAKRVEAYREANEALATVQARPLEQVAEGRAAEERAKQPTVTPEQQAYAKHAENPLPSLMKKALERQKQQIDIEREFGRFTRPALTDIAESTTETVALTKDVKVDVEAETAATEKAAKKGGALDFLTPAFLASLAAIAVTAVIAGGLIDLLWKKFFGEQKKNEEVAEDRDKIYSVTEKKFMEMAKQIKSGEITVNKADAEKGIQSSKKQIEETYKRAEELKKKGPISEAEAKDLADQLNIAQETLHGWQMLEKVQEAKDKGQAAVAQSPEEVQKEMKERAAEEDAANKKRLQEVSGFDYQAPTSDVINERRGGFIGAIAKPFQWIGKQVKDMVQDAFKPEGGRAEGGPVDAGKSYMVGEEGPEMVVPRANANVEPIMPMLNKLKQNMEAGAGAVGVPGIPGHPGTSGAGEVTTLAVLQNIAASLQKITNELGSVQKIAKTPTPLTVMVAHGKPDLHTVAGKQTGLATR